MIDGFSWMMMIMMMMMRGLCTGLGSLGGLIKNRIAVELIKNCRERERET